MLTGNSSDSVDDVVESTGADVSRLMTSSTLTPASDVEAPDSERGIEWVADGATCILRSAKSPLATTVVLRPNTIQVIDPVRFEQEIDLPAAEAATPEDALIEVTLAAGKLIVNSKLAGCTPPMDVNDTGTTAVAPAVLAAEPTISETLWPLRLVDNEIRAADAFKSKTHEEGKLRIDVPR